MPNILLDYVFPITVISPTPDASTAFLKQVCLVCKPNGGGVAGDMTLCTSNAQVAAVTDNTNAEQLFSAGMSRVYILQADDLDIAAFLEDHLDKFYTLLISDDFTDEDIGAADGVTDAVAASRKIQDITYTAVTAGTGGNSITINYDDDGTAGAETVDVTGDAILVHMEDGVSTAQQIADAVNADVDAQDLVTAAVDSGDETDVQASFGAALALQNGTGTVAAGLDYGDFDGVIGVSSDDDEYCAEHAVIEKRCAFFTSASNGAKNLCYAFGKLLSNTVNWTNQQYITMPVSDDVELLGDAEALFDSKVSFVIEDDEFGNRLALFAQGAKAIIAPYVLKNLQIDMQSASLQWISANQPQYTVTEASLLENRLQQDVINDYIARKWISAGVVEISLQESNFVAAGEINVSEPKALWRVFSEMRSSL